MHELAIVLAPQQNHFFVELAAALCDELNALGVDAGVHEGAFPAPRRELVYALLPPHEYFTLMHGRVGPPPDVLDRTIFICAEQPDTPFFDANVELARRGGVVFDINTVSVTEFTRHGIPAEHLPLGWTARWAHLTERERDIDVLFMGCASDRRLRFLASYASQLQHRRCHYVISDNSRPNWQPSATFVTDDEKWDLLGRSKVLINLHQGQTPYFEWLRIVQTIANGCAVVSENSLDHAPLRPGEHFLSGRPDVLGLLAERLLQDPAYRHATATAAWHQLHDRMPFSRSAATLAEAVERLAARPVPAPDSDFFLQPRPAQDPAARLERLAPAPEASELAPLRQAVKGIKLDLIDLRRRLARLSEERNGGPDLTQIVGRSSAYVSAIPLVSVIVSLYNYENAIACALDSLTKSYERSWEVVVVDDGSEDGSLRAAQDWIAAHDRAPALLLRHPVNRGLGHARNTALALVRAPFCFILDADNEIYPGCFVRLLDALRRDDGAAFAYGIHERFARSGPLGLANWMPWNPQQFRIGNYIDAMAMLRTHVLRALGGYGTDRRLHGWEDYDLWCRLAESGGRGAFVPDVVARYRTTEHSMIATTNISPIEAFSLIAERSPALMRDARPQL